MSRITDSFGPFLETAAALQAVETARRLMDEAATEYRGVIPSGDINAMHAAFERWDAAAREYTRATMAAGQS